MDVSTGRQSGLRPAAKAWLGLRLEAAPRGDLVDRLHLAALAVWLVARVVLVGARVWLPACQQGSEHAQEGLNPKPQNLNHKPTVTVQQSGQACRLGEAAAHNQECI